MEINKPDLFPAAIRAFSRRGFLQASTALAAASATPAFAQSGRTIAYVGAYTDRGKGIHMFNLNPADGTLTPWKILEGLPSPSSLAFHPNKKYLYAVNEISNFSGTTNGSVTALSVDSGTGDLRIMNVVSSGGSGPAHVSVDPSGKFVFAANYGGGNFAVLPILPDGSLGSASDVQKITGPLGPQPAVDAPPGSFARSGHDAPHAHMAQTDPAGNFLLVADLGTDRIYVYRLDKVAGTVTPANPPFVQASPGAGPRHFDFHPNGRLAYAIMEEASTMIVMDYNPDSGSLTYKGQTASTLPAGFAGTNYPSEIQVSSDGKFLYGANRLHDSIVIFDLNPDGWMLNARHVWTQGSYPRHFAFEPNGNFFYVCHSRSDNVTSFRLDRNTGMLTFTGQFVPVGNPSKIVFLTL
ncbi:MAG: lactonase family protein [Bryobacteraceae bacterium]|nr:lactonase family protein [Bryobacteraceae bacterium]